MSHARKSLEIICQACGKTALVRVEPVYDGFNKCGENFVCTACGHRYHSRETTPFVASRETPTLFSAEDRTQALQIFKASERRRCCAYCVHRVVNPFGQRCGRLNREVESTDLCDQFEPRSEDESPTAEASKSQSEDPLAQLFGE